MNMLLVNIIFLLQVYGSATIESAKANKNASARVKPIESLEDFDALFQSVLKSFKIPKTLKTTSTTSASTPNQNVNNHLQVVNKNMPSLSTVSTVTPPVKILPTQPSVKVSPSQPPDKISPSQPPENISPTQPLNKISSTQPSDKVSPTQLSDKVSPSQTPDKISSTQAQDLTINIITSRSSNTSEVVNEDDRLLTSSVPVEIKSNKITIISPYSIIMTDSPTSSRTNISPGPLTRNTKKPPVYCQPETVGEEFLKGKYYFTKTSVNTTVRVVCKSGKNTVFRKCLAINNSAVWEDLNLIGCPFKDGFSKTISNIANMDITSENAPILNKNILEMLNDAKFTNDDDVTTLMAVNSRALLKAPSNTDIIKSVVKCVDLVLSEQNDLQISKHSVLKTLERVGEGINSPNEAVVIEEKEVAFAAANPPTGTGLKLTVSSSKKKKINLSFQSEREDGQFLSSITIPSLVFDLFNGSRHTYFYVLRNNKLFRQHQRQMVVSSVISAALEGASVENLPQPIVITFAAHKVADKATCRYWKETGDGVGVWSRNGCLKTSHDKNTITCECNHLTSFSVVLDVTQSLETSLELEIVSWIGCWASVLGLGLTLITFLCFHNLRQKVPSKILICLCVSLLFLLVVFLGGVTQTSSPVLCHGVAVSIHYFTLTTFFWMGVEAINLYRSVVVVFTRGNDGKFFRWAFLLAWVTPAIIVGVNVYFTRDHFIDNDLHEKMCIVRGNSFYFAVLLPICMIMLANLITFIPIIRVILTGARLQKDSIEERQKEVAKRAKASFAVIVIMGLTWIFGVLAIGRLKLIFQWAFCVLNSLQGFFIFLLYVLLNEEAKRAWREMCNGGHDDSTRSGYTAANLKLINTEPKQDDNKPGMYGGSEV